MHAADDRPEFAPPREPALLRAFALAVLAHLLLIAALTSGLRWQREAVDAGVEAELWSAVPQQAAPKVDPTPPAPPAPPPPQPVVKAPPVPEPPAKSQADIAMEREKEKRLQEQRRQAELEKERAERAKAEAAKKKREEELAKKKLEQQKLAEAKRKAEEERKAKLEQQAALEEKKRQALREENMKRMQGMAGGTGAPSSPATAARSSGPSGSWAGRVQARVRPNIVFSDNIPANAEAVVAVRLAPDGTIVSRTLKKSSGYKNYDEAVLRALDKTEVLPRDVDGSVPSSGDLVFKPRS